MQLKVIDESPVGDVVVPEDQGQRLIQPSAAGRQPTEVQATSSLVSTGKKDLISKKINIISFLY